MSCAFSRDLIEKTIAFHGHSCPGLAIGIRAVELAFRELGRPEETDMVAVAETDMCGVDAIQFLTDCTYGKGNFMHRDYGKMAFSFFDRNTGKGLRAVLNPGAWGEIGRKMGELTTLAASDQGTPEIQERLMAVRPPDAGQLHGPGPGRHVRGRDPDLRPAPARPDIGEPGLQGVRRDGHGVAHAAHGRRDLLHPVLRATGAENLATAPGCRCMRPGRR